MHVLFLFLELLFILEVLNDVVFLETGNMTNPTFQLKLRMSDPNAQPSAYAL